jgi:hypothetical protein
VLVSVGGLLAVIDRMPAVGDAYEVKVSAVDARRHPPLVSVQRLGSAATSNPALLTGLIEVARVPKVGDELSLRVSAVDLSPSPPVAVVELVPSFKRPA